MANKHTIIGLARRLALRAWTEEGRDYPGDTDVECAYRMGIDLAEDEEAAQIFLDAFDWKMERVKRNYKPGCRPHTEGCDY